MIGLTKMLSNGSVILKECGMMGFIQESVGNRLVGLLWKRWIDLENDYLTKKRTRM